MLHLQQTKQIRKLPPKEQSFIAARHLLRRTPKQRKQNLEAIWGDYNYTIFNK